MSHTEAKKHQEKLHIEPHTQIGDLLKEAVFGYNDGIVSTFAVIAGLTGGDVGNKTVLLGALATLLAGAFSMGLGTYLGSKSEKELYESELARENWEIDHMPEMEVQEIRDIYSAKGFSGQLLEDVVKQITSNREVWLKTMMSEELGFAAEPPKPGLNGLVMSISFVTGSFISTLPYLIMGDSEKTVWGFPIHFALSLLFTVCGLLLAGGLKTKFTNKNIIWSALETLMVGALAAAGSYGIGVLLQ